MEGVFGKPIVTQEEVRTRVRELGRQITADYAHKDLLLIGILKGAFAFYADLARAIGLPLRVDFLVVSGVDRTKTDIDILDKLTEDVAGRDILLVEDIVDSGLTVQYLRQVFELRHPKSIKVCALLNKPERRAVDVVVDYVGFNIPNKFVIGYGLDYQQKYRNLPYLAALDQAEEPEGA
jgi:hypoxanthine phosphoribosyltransferase